MVNLAEPKYGHPQIRFFFQMHLKEKHDYLRHTLQSFGSLFWLLQHPSKFATVLMKCDALERALIKLDGFWSDQVDGADGGTCWGVDVTLMDIEYENLQEAQAALARLCASA